MNKIKNRKGQIICSGNKFQKELAEINKADLSGANLSRANLYEADLSGADLYGANLYGAKIEFWQFPSIRFLSSIRFKNISDDLQVELMRRDAMAHPHPEKFDAWNKGGSCPYDDVERFWLFEPRKDLWSPGTPQMTDRDLILALVKSQGWKIKGYL